MKGPTWKQDEDLLILATKPIQFDLFNGSRTMNFLGDLIQASSNQREALDLTLEN
jgi:hypothetical protein